MNTQLRDALHAGWYLVAFTDELTQDLTPLQLGDRRLMIARTEGEPGFGLYDATCPHRGANLAFGGELSGSCVVCPFHGRRVNLGESQREQQLSVRGYPTMVLGQLVFARLSDEPEGEAGFSELFPQILGERTVTPAITTEFTVPISYVVENAFDIEHFNPVHDVPKVGDMDAVRHEEGYLQIGGSFTTVEQPWIDMRMAIALQQFLGDTRARSAQTESGFRATAFSPTLVATSFGSTGKDPVIITAAVPTETGCRVRVSVAAFPGDPVEHIVNGSKLAMKQDGEIWDNLDPHAPTQMDERDANIIAYHRFCEEFPKAPSGEPAAPRLLQAAADA